MRALLESERFRAELPGWALRGMLCAASSAFWAVLAGFTSLAEITGMVAGVAGWVVLFALGCAWLRLRGGGDWSRAVAALTWATWIKIGLTMAGWLLAWALSGLRLHGSWNGLVALPCVIDVLLGTLALGAVASLAGLRNAEAVAAADSFGCTALATVIEGALMAALIAALAAGVWVFGRWRTGMVRRCAA